MPYDCSITKRKGCNYCVRGKELSENNNLSFWINDNDCKGNARIKIRTVAGVNSMNEHININYCPICGKELT